MRIWSLAALFAIVVLLILSGASASGAPATSRPLSDHSPGISIVLQPGWQRLTPARDAPPALTLVRRTAGRPPYESRLTVEVLGAMRIGTPRAIAQSVACGLVRSYPTAPIQRRSVSYGGVPGVMLLGVPGRERTMQIVLASHGLVYNIVAFGRSLAADQRAALASLRFISVTGNSRALKMKLRVKPCYG